LNVMVVSIGKTDESTEPPPSHNLPALYRPHPNSYTDSMVDPSFIVVR